VNPTIRLHFILFRIAVCLLGVSSLFPNLGFGEDETQAPLWIPPTQAEWTTDGKKERSDIVNMYFHGTQADVIAAAEGAGWVRAAKNNPIDDTLYAIDGLAVTALKALDITHRRNHPKPYKLEPFMPASTETYHEDPSDPRGEKQDFMFQRGDAHPFGRHHFRVYSTGKVDESGLTVWAVSATEDIGIDVNIKKPAQFFFNHTVDPDADDERNFVYQTLLRHGFVASMKDFSVDPGPANPENGVTSPSGVVYNITLKNE
jgi:hypothetical protein